MSKVIRKIPKVAEDKVVIVRRGGFRDTVNKRFEKIDNILFGVITAVVVSLVAVVVSVAGLFIDQMRYNNAAYREYSEKLETLNSLKDGYNVLADENKQNQKMIIEYQEQILEALNKK